MLRSSCSIMIKQLYDAGKIDEGRKKKCLEFVMKNESHEKIRNLIAMILLPKKIHQNDISQAAYLKAAVSRVSHRGHKFLIIIFNNFRLRTRLFLRVKVP